MTVVVQSHSHVQLFETPRTAALLPPVPHHLLEFAQVHVHCISDAVQPSHPLTSSSPSQSFPASGTFPMIKYLDPFSLVAQSCPTVCDPMNFSMPGFPVHHQLMEITQTHVHLILYHPLLLPPSIFLSIRVFSNESVLHIRWPKFGDSTSTSVYSISM